MVTAGAVAAAINGVGGEMRGEYVGQRLPILRGAQRSGGHHQRSTPAGDGDGDGGAVG
jgi:hypothetical protein